VENDLVIDYEPHDEELGVEKDEERDLGNDENHGEVQNDRVHLEEGDAVLHRHDVGQVDEMHVVLYEVLDKMQYLLDCGELDEETHSMDGVEVDVEYGWDQNEENGGEQYVKDGEELDVKDGGELDVEKGGEMKDDGEIDAKDGGEHVAEEGGEMNVWDV